MAAHHFVIVAEPQGFLDRGEKIFLRQRLRRIGRRIGRYAVRGPQAKDDRQ